MGDLRIGIIGAMPPEIEILHQRMEVRSEEEIASMTFYSGTLGKNEAVLVKCGVGKVNAGICASLLANHFGCTAIINTGVAGALDPGLDVMDIVVSTEAIQHDVDAAAVGYDKYTIPGINMREFPADKKLRKIFVEAVRETAPEVHVYEGSVISGDQFISSEADKKRLYAGTGGLCCEMEGAAVAQAAWLFHVPYVIIRAISDKVGVTSAMEYNEFERVASLKVSEITAAAVMRMGENL